MTDKKPDRQVLRLLDANFNRAREAIRVIEDYARFCLDSPLWTGRLKEMRHALREALRKLDADSLLASRDTEGDVGTPLSTEQEFSREDARDVAAGNLKRLQEALRTIEEYSKLISPEAAAEIKQIRYQSYSVEKGLVLLPTAANEIRPPSDQSDRSDQSDDPEKR